MTIMESSIWRVNLTPAGGLQTSEIELEVDGKRVTMGDLLKLSM